MNRIAAYLPIGFLMLSVGCYSGGWCGSNQPAYPVGTYPMPGYPGGGYQNPGYPAGAVGQSGYPVAPGGAPGVNGQQAPSLPFGTPIPPSYPQAGYPAGYPTGYPAGANPQNQGVPLQNMSPSQPFFGR